MDVKKENAAYILVYLCAAAFVIVICLLGIPCCDDYFFQAWEFLSVKDMFLLHPSNSPMYSFVPQNGRYLGNFMGLFFSRTYGSLLGTLIRTALITLSISAMCYLLCKICKADRRMAVVICLLLVLSPLHYYTQIYHWTAGFSNYFFSVLGFLGSLYYIAYPPEKKVSLLAAFVMAMTTQFFIEHITVFSVCFLSCVCAWKWYQDKKIPRHLLVLWAGACLGAILMFAYPGYYQTSGEQYKSVGLEHLFFTVRLLSFDAVVSNGLIWCVAGLMFEGLEYRSQRIRRMARVPYWICAMYCLVRTCQVSLGLASYRRVDIIVAALFVFVLAVVILNMKEGRVKWHSIVWFACLLLINGMLLVVSPISARCAFISYILSVLWLMDLGKETAVAMNGWMPKMICLLAGMAMIYGGFLIRGYQENYVVTNQMLEYVEKRMETGQPSLYLPKYEQAELVMDANSEIYYLQRFYYETQGDIYMELHMYDYWYQNHYLPEMQ